MSGVVKPKLTRSSVSREPLRHCLILPILTSGSAVQVNDDFEAVVPSPSDRLLQVRQLAGNVRFPGPDFERPVSDGYADVVQPGSGGMSVKNTMPGRDHVRLTLQRRWQRSQTL